MRPLRSISALLVSILALTAAVPASAAAAGPHMFGPFTNTYSFIGFNCPGFDIQIQGSGTDEYTIWRDDAGDLTKVFYRGRYPHDTLTNTVTGRSIVVRGEFQETNVPIAGTDEFTKTITGFRYIVDEPGTGVTIRDVGRIVYGDLEQTVLLWEAGQHDLVFDRQLDGVFCGALA
jgi:hypothetical protein